MTDYYPKIADKNSNTTSGELNKKNQAEPIQKLEELETDEPTEPQSNDDQPNNNQEQKPQELETGFGLEDDRKIGAGLNHSEETSSNYRSVQLTIKEISNAPKPESDSEKGASKPPPRVPFLDNPFSRKKE